MFKPKGLLKVISILMIIFGVLGAAFMLLIYFMLPQLIPIYEDMGVDVSLIEQAFTPLSIAISVVSSLFCTLAGVFGVSGKSMRLTMIFGGIYTLIVVIKIISSIVESGFTASLILSVIIPILYWWGIYQSKEV
ncbi:MAG: hypothetical protein ACRC3H_18805 [Lachnospiraceae bacterium]